MPPAMHGYSPVPGGPSSFPAGQLFSLSNRGAHSGRGGRRLTIDPVVIRRDVHEATGFDKEALDRSMKMFVPTRGPNTNFKQWKRNFLAFLSLKAAYLTPQLAIRETGVWLDEQAQNYGYALLLNAANESKRVGQAVKCVSASRPDCATRAWDILCDRLDGRSSACSLPLPGNLMLRQRPGHSLTKYVHFIRQPFDDNNETCEMIDGSAAIHPHHLGFQILRGIYNSGPFGQAKQCVINAVDTNYLMSADEVMANILHLAQNMDTF
jgi:hypothetical protein